MLPFSILVPEWHLEVTYLTRYLNGGLGGHCTVSMCNGGSRMSAIWTGLWSGSTVVGTRRRSSTIRHGWLAVCLLRSLPMHTTKLARVLAVDWSALGRMGLLPTVVVRIVVLTTSRLRNVGLDGHATGHNVRCSTTASGVLGGCWATETFRKLLHESLCDVVDSNVHSISDT